MSLKHPAFIVPITPAIILRKFSRNFRWRIHTITLHPHCDIRSIDDNKYLKTGLHPQFFLQGSRQSLPTEWVIFHGEISHSAPLKAELVFFSNSGICPNNKVTLKINSDGTINELIRIPNNTSKIRLDLSAASENEFTISNLSIKEKGLWQVALWHILIRLQIIFRSDYLELFRIVRRGIELYKNQGWQGIMLGLDRDRRQLGAKAVSPTKSPQLTYLEWQRKNEQFTISDISKIKSIISTSKYRPHFSIIVPVFSPEFFLNNTSTSTENDYSIELKATINSIFKQLYQEWELCIISEATYATQIKKVLTEFAKDKRVRLTICSPTDKPMSKAVNMAIQIVSGQYITLLAPGDILAEHALFLNALEINKNPKLTVCYSDEDQINQTGQRYAPYFKPNWNPLLFLGQNYFHNLTIFETDAVRQAGEFNIDLKGCHNWDLALRITERCSDEQIHHLPHILCHSQTIKSVSEDAAREILSAHFQRVNKCGTKIELLERKYWHFRFPLPAPPPLVSIIIPTHNQYRVLSQCINSILNKTNYPNFEIIIVDNKSNNKQTQAYLANVSTKANIQILKYDKIFNYSAINNFAVKKARGTIVALLNNDIEVISHDWLLEMVSHATQPNCGAVGCMLYYPNDTIQHAGVILGIGGVAGHAYLGKPRGYAGQKGRAHLSQNISAITAACMVLRKTVFEEVGGFNEKDLPIAFNDIDLCLRILEQGYKNVFTPFAELYHHESLSRGYEDTIKKQARFRKEANYMRAKWKDIIDNDPAFNPNLAMNAMKWIWGTNRKVSKPWE